MGGQHSPPELQNILILPDTLAKQMAGVTIKESEEAGKREEKAGRKKKTMETGESVWRSRKMEHEVGRGPGHFARNCRVKVSEENVAEATIVEEHQRGVSAASTSNSKEKIDYDRDWIVDSGCSPDR